MNKKEQYIDDTDFGYYSLCPEEIEEKKMKITEKRIK